MGVAFLIVVAMVGGTVLLMLNGLSRLSDLGGGRGSSGFVHESPLYNYRFQFPPTPWKIDEHTKLEMKTGIVLRRTDPNAWTALFTTDYKERTPQDAELIDEGVRRLKTYFKDQFEWEQQPDDHLAGQRAQRFDFVGEVNSVEMTGQCYVVSYHGIAYWFVTWTPAADKDMMAEEWDGIRQGFSLLKERDGWAPKQPKRLTLVGQKAPITLAYIENVWEKRDEPAGYDTDADAALLGHDVNAPQDTDKTATALVLLLPKQKELKAAVAAARDHLLAQQKKLYPRSSLEEADGRAQAEDRPPDVVGTAMGRIVKLRVKNSEELAHFVYLAVVPVSDQVVVVQCDCDWRRRVYWEVNFSQLVRELRVNK